MVKVRKLKFPKLRKYFIRVFLGLSISLVLFDFYLTTLEVYELF